jgi:N utilization substance protein B
MTSEALVGAGLSQAEAESARLAATAMKGQADYFLRIVRGVTQNREAIDAAIARIAPEWPVDQMAPIDRNVLRVALWEIATAACPIRVAINEAVELARAYSGESARRLVNGALGTFVSEGHRIEHMQTEEEWPSP